MCGCSPFYLLRPGGGVQGEVANSFGCVNYELRIENGIGNPVFF